MKILVLNGPNLNQLTQRETRQYGSLNLEGIKSLLIKEFPSHSFKFHQSNIEGELIVQVQNAQKNYDGIIINPGGYSHTSVALKDALEMCLIPKIEVHLSNLSSREDFRQNLITASSCDGYISGFKENSYLAAVYVLERIFNSK